MDSSQDSHGVVLCASSLGMKKSKLKEHAILKVFFNQTFLLWFQRRPQLCSHRALCQNPNHTIFWLRLPESNETSIFSLSSTDKMELLHSCSGLSHGWDRPVWMLSLSNSCHLFFNHCFSLLVPNESFNCQTHSKKGAPECSEPQGSPVPISRPAYTWSAGVMANAA